MKATNKFADLLADLFRPLYERLFGNRSDFVDSVQSDLAKSRNETNAEVYLSRSLGVGFALGILLWLISSIVGFALIQSGVIEIGNLFSFRFPRNPIIIFFATYKEFFVVGIAGILMGVLGTILVIAPAVFIPKFKAGSRQSEIEILMPDMISYMYALSQGGLNQIELMRKVADADDTYGELSKEFQSIINETEYFDTDYRTAIQNQIEVTPSTQFAQFLADMLSILDSGGDIQSFLKDKQQKHIRLAKQHQERDLDTLELLGEIYMTVSLFPLLLMIILVIMSMMGQDSTMKLYGTVYGLIPVLGLAFLVLLSMVKQDTIGNGELENPAGASSYTETRVLNFPTVSKYAGKAELFDKAKRQEQTYQTRKILTKPHIFFREHPGYTFFITVPAAIVAVYLAISSGVTPTTWSAFQKAHVWGTFIYFYIPVYVTLTPFAVFSFWKNRRINSVTGNLSDMLRKLSSANDAGQPLLESIQTVTKSSSGRLADELREIRSKVMYGARMQKALVEFNNKYRIPRLARIVKLVSDAQETSDDITEVLSTAAQTSETQDDIRRQQKNQTMQQLAIILMTYVILLGVMALLKTQFIEVMGNLTEQASQQSSGGSGGQAGFGANVDTQLLSMLFFHAVTLQALISGFLGGYMRTNQLRSGIKFVLILLAIAFGVWLYIS